MINNYLVNVSNHIFSSFEAASKSINWRGRQIHLIVVILPLIALVLTIALIVFLSKRKSVTPIETKFPPSHQCTMFCEGTPWELEVEGGNAQVVEKAKAAGVVALIHKTYLPEVAVQILTSAGLKPQRKYLKNLRHPIVVEKIGEDFLALGPGKRTFLQLLTKDTSDLPHASYYYKKALEDIKVDPKMPFICFIFSLDLLARTDYHLTVGWNHAVISPIYSYPPSQIDAFLEKMKKESQDPSVDPYMSNEVVFREEISLETLKGLVVHPEIYDEFIATLGKSVSKDEFTKWKNQIHVGEVIPKSLFN